LGTDDLLRRPPYLATRLEQFHDSIQLYSEDVFLQTDAFVSMDG